MEMDLSLLVGVVVVVLAAGLLIAIARGGVSRDGSSVRVVSGAIPAIVVLLVAVLVVGALSPDPDEGSDYEVYDCVPLSSFGPSVESVEGPAEVVEIGGVQYVRMTGLGAINVTAGGSQVEYTVGKAKMDLVLFAGQSNAVAYTAPSLYDGPTTVSPGKAFYIGMESIHSDTYGPQLRENNLDDRSKICDIVSDDGSMRVAGMYPAFCGDYVRETGHRLMTLNAAIGGMSISGWDAGGRADAFMESGVDFMKDLCSGKVDLTPVGVLWVQGEANASQTVVWYLERFGDLCDRLESGHYGGLRFPHIMSSLPRTSMRPYDNMINPALAQIDYADIDPKFSVATSIAYRATDAQYLDGLHFTQEYYGWAGEAFARHLAEVRGVSPVPESIVVAEPLGTVQSLPSKATAYGTSGEGFLLDARWEEMSEPGTYAATLSGNPAGTAIAPGLTVEATVGSG